MPKKQKLNIASSRRWDLARDGMPDIRAIGKKLEPWPPWLSKTFVNETLLQEDPLELRDDLFGSSRHPDNTWRLIDNLLFAVEHNAKSVLKEQPLPFCDLENDDSKDWDYFASEISEDRFYARFARCKTLTHKQRNAIAALRSIHLIRAASHAVSPHGHWLCDAFHDHTYDSLSVAKIIMETVTLTLAAIRGELWENVWPHTERGAAVLRGSKKGRTDELNKAMEEVLAKRGTKLTAKEVWALLEKTINYDSVIQEVYDDNICWVDQRGREQTTSYKSFENRLSKIKKTFSS